MLISILKLKGKAMERSNPLRLTARDGSILSSACRKAGEVARGWLDKRRAGKALEELSDEQLRDCGIDSLELNVASLEVARGLMHRLMAMR
jgi:uncharacterized protein YjiS (DUF1127 family)